MYNFTYNYVSSEVCQQFKKKNHAILCWLFNLFILILFQTQRVNISNDFSGCIYFYVLILKNC